MEVTIPTEPSDIPLSKYIECYKIGQEESLDQTWRAKKIIKTITGVGFNTLEQIPIRQLDQIANKIGLVLQTEQEFKQRFTWKGIEYGFIPNLEDLTTAEFVDIDSYGGDEFIENLHVVMAILYRPIKEEFKDLYSIEPYKGTDGEHFKDLPLSIIQGALAFFLRLGQGLLQTTLDSLTESETKVHLPDMVGTMFYSPSQMETS